MYLYFFLCFDTSKLKYFTNRRTNVHIDGRVDSVLFNYYYFKDVLNKNMSRPTWSEHMRSAL